MLDVFLGILNIVLANHTVGSELVDLGGLEAPCWDLVLEENVEFAVGSTPVNRSVSPFLYARCLLGLG